jgi:hypothetical protein
MKYRKRPVVIEAMQFLPGDAAALFDWLEANDARFVPNGETELEIRTLEDGRDGRAKHVASAGDWIIKGVQGEFYACKPDIFAATYEPVDNREDTK